MTLVGVSGKLTHGKDTAAAVLIREQGYTRWGFADALRAEVRARLPRTLAALAEAAGQSVDALIAAKPPVIRALLQEYGTEVRRQDDPDYWLHAWFRTRPAGRLVVPDVRFPNEAAYLRDLGAKLVRIIRPGVETGTHLSETALDGWTRWDAVLVNDGTVAALEDRVRAWWEGR